jgi:3-hydroxyisobutyrate dehydrogenase
VTARKTARDPSAQVLGWVGAGRMGTELVRRLLRGGYDVALYNRTRAKAERLAEEGAKVVDSLAELAGRDVVFTTVGSSEDFLDVTVRPGGLLAGESAPQVIVDCSTVSAESSALARQKAEERGTMLLAAPVSGNPTVARAGLLTMAVSGPREGFERVEAILEVLGAGATYVGEGEGARTVKICHNLFLGTVAQSLAEVTVLAEKSGISRHAFLSYLNKSVMGSVFTGYKTPALVNLDFKATFTAALLRKDFELGLAAARQLEVPLPVGALVHQIIQSLVGRGYGDMDFAALLALEADSAGLELVSEDVDVTDGLPPG